MDRWKERLKEQRIRVWMIRKKNRRKERRMEERIKGNLEGVIKIGEGKNKNKKIGEGGKRGDKSFFQRSILNS